MQFAGIKSLHFLIHILAWVSYESLDYILVLLYFGHRLTVFLNDWAQTHHYAQTTWSNQSWKDTKGCDENVYCTDVLWIVESKRSLRYNFIPEHIGPSSTKKQSSDPKAEKTDCCRAGCKAGQQMYLICKHNLREVTLMSYSSFH